MAVGRLRLMGFRPLALALTCCQRSFGEEAVSVVKPVPAALTQEVKVPLSFPPLPFVPLPCSALDTAEVIPRFMGEG